MFDRILAGVALGGCVGCIVGILFALLTGLHPYSWLGGAVGFPAGAMVAPLVLSIRNAK